MISLRFQFNGIMTVLAEGKTPKFCCAPVLLRDGDFQRVHWLGFIDLEDAKQLMTAKPVELDIRQYSVTPSSWPKWRPIPPHLAVQGCLTGDGVYAVTKDGAPRLVPRSQTTENNPQ